jgi:hypothetical protein
VSLPSTTLHSDVEVTDAEGEQRALVSQVFCSALAVAYTRVPSAHWKPFASLVLQAYEATMLPAVLNKQRGASNVVLLTLLGGGAFGNEDDWIYAANRAQGKPLFSIGLGKLFHERGAAATSCAANRLRWSQPH